MSMMMRRGMMVPKAPGGLPSEYLQVQYLKGTGTQYIDVDTTPKGYEFEITFMLIATRGDGAMVTGYSTWNDANAWAVFQTSSALQVRRRKGVSGTTYDAVANVSDILNKKITASAYKTYAEIYDEETGTTINKNTEDCSSSIRFYDSTVTLFRGESDYGYSARRVKAQIYSAKFYLNGTLAYDLVPCIRISDSKPGMYDLVGRQFYTNSGTGEFIAGWTLLPEQDGRVEKAKIPLLNGQHVKMTWDTSQLSTAIPGANESVLSFYNQTGMVWNAMNPVPTCSSHVIVSRNMIDNNVFFGGTIEFDMPADANLFVGYWQDSDTTDRRIKGDYINIQIS